MRCPQSTLLAVVLTLLLALPPVVAAAAAKVALVIGNSEYPSGPLPNPANDAKLMADTLEALGFDVILRRNADQITMKRAIQDFGARLEKAGPAGVGLFFYAGHGAQLNGRNYLIPTTARIEREGDVEIEAVSADWVIEQMRFARNGLNFVVLDACRNNPFTRSMRSVDRGLATMDAPAGILIAYSTAPGSVAADGDGRNSPYTEALSKAMRESQEPVEQVFKHVRVSVMHATSGKQVPWESSSLTGDFFFTPPAKASGAGVALPPPAAQAAAPAASPGFFESLFGGSAPKPAAVTGPAAAPAVGPSVSGARALPLLNALGIGTGDMTAEGKYPPASVRQMLESAPRAVVLGSTAQQIDAAYKLCRQYSPACQRSWYADESVRRATLAPFEMDIAPVSVAAFRSFAEGAHFKTGAETTGYAYAVVDGKLKPVTDGNWRNAVKQHPVSEESAVVAVNFADAAAYCRSKSARLPSEDEWEYAARGSERRTFPWGEDVGPAAKAPTGLPPRAADGPAEGMLGRYRGLAGNVWQWADTTVNHRKVLKGGSWLEPNPANKRAATRRYEVAQRADEDSGFRCARNLSTWPDAETWMAQLK